MIKFDASLIHNNSIEGQSYDRLQKHWPQLTQVWTCVDSLLAWVSTSFVLVVVNNAGFMRSRRSSKPVIESSRRRCRWENKTLHTRLQDRAQHDLAWWRFRMIALTRLVRRAPKSCPAHRSRSIIPLRSEQHQEQFYRARELLTLQTFLARTQRATHRSLNVKQRCKCRTEFSIETLRSVP